MVYSRQPSERWCRLVFHRDFRQNYKIVEFGHVKSSWFNLKPKEKCVRELQTTCKCTWMCVWVCVCKVSVVGLTLAFTTRKSMSAWLHAPYDAHAACFTSGLFHSLFHIHIRKCFFIINKMSLSFPDRAPPFDLSAVKSSCCISLFIFSWTACLSLWPETFKNSILTKQITGWYKKKPSSDTTMSSLFVF